MDKLYYVKYSQESEAYVKASSSQEAVDYIEANWLEWNEPDLI